MSSRAPQVAVIIVSYNTRRLLRDCLQSLQAAAGPSLRVLVVDNCSHDGSATMVSEEFPACELLLPEHNLGFAGGNNLGLAHLGLLDPAAEPDQAAAPEYVLLLNPDTVVHRDAIARMLAFLEQHPRVAVVGPRLLNPDGSVQTAAFRFPTVLMSLLEVFPPGEVLPGRLYNSWWHGRYPQEPTASAPFAIDHPLGACMLVRAAAIRAVGGFDEGYFMYSEEIDWCFRIRRAGWAIWQQPAARVTHIGGAATSQFRRAMLLELHRSRLRFFRQHDAAWRLLLHRLVTRLGMVRIALQSWHDYQRGRIDLAALRLHLLSCGEISRL